MATRDELEALAVLEALDAVARMSDDLVARAQAMRVAVTANIWAPDQCRVPPTGWVCSRMPGHPGPCAASPGGLVETIDATVCSAQHGFAASAVLRGGLSTRTQANMARLFGEVTPGPPTPKVETLWDAIGDPDPV